MPTKCSCPAGRAKGPGCGRPSRGLTGPQRTVASDASGGRFPLPPPPRPQPGIPGGNKQFSARARAESLFPTVKCSRVEPPLEPSTLLLAPASRPGGAHPGFGPGPEAPPASGEVSPECPDAPRTASCRPVQERRDVEAVQAPASDAHVPRPAARLRAPGTAPGTQVTPG